MKNLWRNRYLKIVLVYYQNKCIDCSRADKEVKRADKNTAVEYDIRVPKFDFYGSTFRELLV